MGTVAYRQLTHAEELFRELIWKPGIKAGELALETAVPLLAAPIIKEVEEEVVELLLNYAFNQIVLFVDVTTIRLVNQQLQREYDSASLQLKILAISCGFDSPEYLQARENAKKSFSDFARYGTFK